MKNVNYLLFSLFLIVCLTSTSQANRRGNSGLKPISFMEKTKPSSPITLYYQHVKMLLKHIPLNRFNFSPHQQENDLAPLLRFPLTNANTHLLKTNETTSLLDSVILKASGHFYRYINTYDESNRVKSELTQTTWDTSLKNWQDTLRVSYDYDESGNLTLFMIEEWVPDSSKWFNSSKYEYKYDGNGQMIESVYFIGDKENNQWLKYFKNERIYNEAGDIVSILTQLWDEVTESWVNTYLLANTYDENGFLIQALFQYWDSFSAQWINSSQETYTYYPEGSLETTTSAYWGGEDWVYNTRVTLFYDSSQISTTLQKPSKAAYFNDFILSLMEKYDSETNEWKWHSKEEREFNDQNLLTKSTYSEFNEVSNDWEYKKRLSMTYTEAFGDFNSKLLSTETQKWIMDEQGSRWQGETLTQYDYDSKGNLTTEVQKEWDVGSNFYIDKFKINFDYNADNLPVHFSSLESLNGIWIGYDTYVDIEVGNNYFSYFASELDAYYSTTTSLEEFSTSSPGEYVLSQNFPNPFNPLTTIQYSIGKEGNVLLEVYNVLGKKIVTLVNQEQPAGKYSILFDASSLSSGMYYFRLKANSFSKTRKMLLLK